MIVRTTLRSLCKDKVATLGSQHSGMIDYIDISSVDNTQKTVTGMQTLPVNDAPSRAKQLLQKGDVLVSTVRPNLNAVAMVENETDNLLVGSTGYCVLRCKEQIDQKLVFYFCQSPYFVEDMTSQATGASYPAVSSNIVKSSLIPCYDITAKKKIIAYFDEVYRLIALQQEQLKKLDELVKSRKVGEFGCSGLAVA